MHYLQHTPMTPDESPQNRFLSRVDPAVAAEDLHSASIPGPSLGLR